MKQKLLTSLAIGMLCIRSYFINMGSYRIIVDVKMDIPTN